MLFLSLPRLLCAPEWVIDVPKSPMGPAPTGRTEIAVGNRTSLWISGWSFRSDHAAVLERAVFSIVGGGRIGAWVPGDPRTEFPPGVAQRLPAGAALWIEFHYRKSSAAEMPGGTLQLFLGDARGRTINDRTLGSRAEHPCHEHRSACRDAAGRQRRATRWRSSRGGPTTASSHSSLFRNLILPTP